jgi:hypothetical protein
MTWEIYVSGSQVGAIINTLNQVYASTVLGESVTLTVSLQNSFNLATFASLINTLVVSLFSSTYTSDSFGTQFSAVFSPSSVYTAYPSVFNALFGNATQTLNQLIIQKSDFPGLTASPTNSAQSLLVGLIYRCFLMNGVDTNGKISISFWRESLSSGKRTISLVISFYSALPVTDTVTNYATQYSKINPNDF